MKRLTLILVGCLACYGQARSILPQKRILTQKQSVDGVYEYIYPWNVKGLIENQYIVLKANNGLYYGTSDEFDSAREGVPPGFFVANMQELQIIRDSIRFKIKISSADLFNKPVALRFKSSADAKKAGYKLWGNKIPLGEKWYRGKISGSHFYFKAEISDFNKTFIRKGSS